MTYPISGERSTLRDRTGLVRGHLASRGPELLALSALAVAQPLLDLFGRNPEFFVASGSTRPEIMAFALLVAFAVPALALVTEVVVLVLFGPKVAAVVHGLWFGLLAFVFGLALASDLGQDSTATAVLIGLIAAVGLVLLRHRFAGVRLMLRYLGFAPLFFFALFLFTSATGELFWAGEAGAEADVRVGGDAPVVFVMFDELPLASLLREDGTINEARFPNFARLAAAGTWYRNATSVSAATVRSVPSALSGDLPEEGAIPTSSDYPQNLFTLLGEDYAMDVQETITDLCPGSICAPDGSAGFGRFVTHLRQALVDATVVYGHIVLPESWRSDLPTVDQSWEGFLETTGQGDLEEVSVDPGSLDAGALADEDRTEFFDRMRSQNRDAFAGFKGEALLRSIESATFAPRRLFFAHESFPHFDWERTPEGGVYRGRGGPPGTVDGRWQQEPFLVRQGLQRHLLQVGYADTVLGRLIDRLQDEGLWDDAIVVVAADHGIAFQAGSPTRQPTGQNFQEIYRVPLLVKVPGQTEGRTDDRNALLTDIVPTIVDLLDVEVDWEFDGQSLVGPPRTDPTKPVIYSGPDEVTGGFGEAVQTARRNAFLIPFEGPWPTVARVGPYAELVGRQVQDLRVIGPSALRWSVEEADTLADYAPGADLIPLVLHGSAVLDSEDPPTDGLVVLNGRVAGALELVPVTDGEDGALTFTVLIDHSQLRVGANSIQLLVPGADERLPSWRVAVPD